jgi:25S rRNA (cytosine2278-C5)-methyltransferase
MSVYFDAVSIVQNPSTEGGSFKSRIYNSNTLKSSPAQVYALITETAKWDILLKEVIENSELLLREQKVRLIRATKSISLSLSSTIQYTFTIE